MAVSIKPKGTQKQILASSFFNHGQKLISLLPGRVIIWDTTTKIISRSIKLTISKCLMFDNTDDGYIAIAHQDNAIRLISPHSLTVTKRYYNEHPVTAMIITRQYIVAGNHHGLINLWKYRNKQLSTQIQAHTGPITALAYPHNATMDFLSGSQDGSIKAWKSGKQTMIISDDTRGIVSINLSFDDTLIVSACADNTIRVWDISRKSVVSIYRGHTRAVFDAKFNHTATLVASIAADNTIRLWGTGNNAVVYEISNGNSISFHPTDNVIVVSGESEFVQLWTIPPIEFAPVSLSGDITCATLSRDASLLALSDTTSIFVWNLASETSKITIPHVHLKCINSLSFGLHNQCLVSCSDDESIVLSDLTSGRIIRIYIGHYAPVKSAIVSEDKSFIVSIGDDKTVRFWDVVSGDCYRTIQLNTIPDSIITFSTQTTILVKTATSINQYSIPTSDLLSCYPISNSVYMSIGHESSLLAIAVNPTTINFYYTKTSQHLHTLFLPHPIQSMAQSQTHPIIAFVYTHIPRIDIWNISLPDPIFTLSVSALSVSFSNNGKLFIVISKDGSFTSWKINNNMSFCRIKE
jgi:WD40 repeat protein